MDIIFKYFPGLTPHQKKQISAIGPLYNFWNQKINVISRKDISEIYERHVLHSLSVAKIISFHSGTHILDVGTGGGFPGIPLAILFPKTDFHLVDSIGKKIRVVTEVAKELGLSNVRAEQIRAEKIGSVYDFVVSRAVTSFPRFVSWVIKNISGEQKNSLPNGILYLKGGEFTEEIEEFGKQIRLFDLKEFFNEEYFESKKLIYLPSDV